MEFEQGDRQSIVMTMNVIKVGLLSENLEVTTYCARVLNKLHSVVQERTNTNVKSTYVIHILFAWFIHGR